MTSNKQLFLQISKKHFIFIGYIVALWVFGLIFQRASLLDNWILATSCTLIIAIVIAIIWKYEYKSAKLSIDIMNRVS